MSSTFKNKQRLKILFVQDELTQKELKRIKEIEEQIQNTDSEEMNELYNELLKGIAEIGRLRKENKELRYENQNLKKK